ncbi:putative metallocarboxypeptidase ecm14 [Colletotrichum spinosum]|uniref:Inactive metallocarboxypeptidase ECM14 n=1 Tax=Colletotrichum spinosum TaxID=1347390 RepID=A0A4R8PYX3_9PEZI|nr:putative metallocarboxypeptidase ecm14 [Colletotrichum spinosum]
MRPRAALSLACCTLIIPLGVARFVPRSNTHPHAAVAAVAETKPRLFPLLTWIRDGVVELVFGSPSSKASSNPANHLPIDLRSKYVGQVVLRFNITTPEEETAFADAASRLLLDVWTFNHDYVDVRLRYDDIATLRGVLPKSLTFSYSTLIPDLARAVSDTYPGTTAPTQIQRLGDDHDSLQSSRSGSDNVFFQDYQPLSVIVPWMRLMEAMFPSTTQLVSIGKSYEGRDIHGLKVGVKDAKKPDEKRKTVIVTGGMHAREWISATTTNYVAWSFITTFGKEPMISKLLEHFDFIFIPVVNPDGFEYTWKVDRLWRKSRQSTGTQWCRGFDLDHAFGFEWNSLDLDNDPCSESYGGKQPWEAREAIALAQWAKNASQDTTEFIGLIDLHSYSQQVLFPFAYSCDVDPPNVENLEELAAGLAKAIRLSDGESYSVTSACEGAVASLDRQPSARRIESGGGSAIDWFYHEVHAHYSYQIKLRDTGSYGFLLPKDNIVPVGEEIFDAMKYFGDYLLGNNGIEKSSGFTSQSAELKRLRR